jgi:acetolactate synthase-1/3 small subunit
VELAGTEEKIEKFVELMKPYGIRELARTGVIAMARGMQPLKEAEKSAGSKRKRSIDAPSAAALPPS